MSTPFHLHGKTVFVTGASSGIGRATAVMAARMGAQVIITGRDETRLQAALAELPGAGHRAVRADLKDLGALPALVKELPPVDGFVSCAGRSHLRPLKFITAAELRDVGVVNYEAPVLLTNELAKQRKLKADGAIVYIASIGAMVGTAGIAVYGGTKAALIAVTRNFANELARSGVRVNSISPGMVDTPLAEQLSTEISPEIMAADKRQYPLGHGRPDDVAAAVVYLLSPATRWVTGINLVMDGGYLIR